MYFISFSDSKGIIKTISINKPIKSHINLQKQLFDTLLRRRNKSEDKEPGSAEFKTKIIPLPVSSFLGKCLNNTKVTKMFGTEPRHGLRKVRAAIWQEGAT